MILALARTIHRDITQVNRHRRNHGWRETMSWLGSREAPFTFQFVKYAASGVASTLILLLVFTALTHTVLPAHDYVAGGLSDNLKERNAILSNLIAFPLANQVAYQLNVLFVFTPGRHSRRVEFLLFTSVSLFSFGAGLLGGPLLISRGLNPWIAQVGFVITSALVNFACRKYIIFHR